jgi:predicted MFS family arabinose efflux permease
VTTTSYSIRREGAVRNFAIARFAAALGSSLVPTAMAFGILDELDASASSLGLVVAAGSACLAVGLLPGGVLADRVSRRRVMVGAELLAAVTSVASGALFATGHATIVLLAIMAAMNGLATALFSPAVTGFVPEIARAEVLQQVNADLRMAMNLARIVGTALAGALVATWSTSGAMAVAAVAAMVAAVLIALVPTPNRVGAAATTNVLRDFARGWHEFRSRRWIVVVVTLGAVSNLGTGAMLGVLGPLRSNEVFSGAASWAVITSALAAGTLAGAVVARRVRTRRPLALAVVLLAMFSLPIAAMSVPLHLALVVALAAVAGVALDVFTVLWDTTLQREIPSDVLSRVSAFDWLGTFALAPLAMAGAGPVADAIGPGPTLGGAALLAAVPLAALLEPDVRRVRPS